MRNTTNLSQQNLSICFVNARCYLPMLLKIMHQLFCVVQQSVVFTPDNVQLLPIKHPGDRAGFLCNDTEGPSRKLCSTAEPPGKQHDGSGVEEGGCGGDSGLEVAGEAAVAAQPSKGALDDLAPRLGGKAALPGLLAYDLDGNEGSCGHTLTGVAASAKACSMDG